MVDIPEQAVQAAQNSIRTTNWEYGITDADMAKALTAAAPHMSGVKVKQLRWREKDSGAYAHCSVGYYEIKETRLGFCVYHNKFLVSKDMFETLESAKVAAQDNLERRLFLCLSGKPVDVAAVREHALDLSVLERIAEKAEEFDHPDDLGPYPDIQDAMITVGDLRKLRKLLATIRQNAEEVIAAERMKLEATARVSLQLSEKIEALEADSASLIHDLNRIKDHETELINDNAAKDARIADLEADNKRLRDALEIIDDHALRCANLVKSDPCARAYVKNILDEARAALEVKP